MDPSRRIGIAATIFVLLIKECVNLDCSLFGDEVVCVAGLDDFVLRKGVASAMTQATKVTIRNCRIIALEAWAFEDVFYLQYLDLSENKISSLLPGVLDGNTLMTHLNLSYNLLTTLPAGVFDQKPNLDVLDLRGNRINSLPTDIFVAQRKLHHLDLSNNAFLGRDMSPYLFGKTWKIQSLDLSQNDMSGSPENLLNAIQELHVLNMDRCALKEVPHFATKANLRTLTDLVLSINEITKIDQPRTFMELVNLEILDLAGNLIENVAANVFVYLKNVKVIILRDNKLKILPDGIFRNLAKLNTVDLSHNMLEYVPLNAFRGTAIQILNLSQNRFSYLDVYFYSQLRNTGIRISKLYIEDNPWQCACLNDALKEMKAFGIEYNGDKYNGRQIVCVTTIKFTCDRELVNNNLFVDMYDDVIRGVSNRS